MQGEHVVDTAPGKRRRDSTPEPSKDQLQGSFLWPATAAAAALGVRVRVPKLPRDKRLWTPAFDVDSTTQT